MRKLRSATWLASFGTSLVLLGVSACGDENLSGRDGGVGGQGGSRDAAAKLDGAVSDAAAGADGTAGGGAGGTVVKLDGGTADGSPDGSPGDGGKADGGPGDAGGPTLTMATVGAGGGMLTLGSAKLTIPAGALAADKVITINSLDPPATLPNRADIVGQVYNLGPDGTTFTKPVQIELPIPGVVPSGKQAVLAWLDGRTLKWNQLPTSVVGATATTWVSHFTWFTVMIVGNEQATCTFAGGCGGAIAGTWSIQGACGDFPPTHKDLGPCEGTGSSVLQEFRLAGTIQFTGDGTYSNQFTRHITQTVTATAACITKLNQANQNVTACADLNTKIDANTPHTCTGSTSTACVCTAMTTQPQAQEGGTYSTNGNSLTMTKTGGSPHQQTYCVSGSTLKVLSDDGIVYTGTKAQ